MREDERIWCEYLPCKDVNHAGIAIPRIEIDPDKVSIVLISESSALKAEDNYYSGGDALFEQTTLQAFRDAGAKVDSYADILGLGVYLTPAVKCRKSGYVLESITIDECSKLLEQEIALFHNWKVMLLMGDAAIRALNMIAKRNGEKRVIPAGSTYKIRGGEFDFRGRKVLPSYLQAGPSFFIEKSKRRMIAEDIRTALEIAGK